MDRKLVLESKTELLDGRVRLVFTSDPRHFHAEFIIERQVKNTQLIQAFYLVGKSYLLEQIIS